jgi:hypothetical protein
LEQREVSFTDIATLANDYQRLQIDILLSGNFTVRVDPRIAIDIQVKGKL